MNINSVDIKCLSSVDKDFDSKLQKLLEWEKAANLKIDQLVSDVLTGVRQKGDQALVEYTNQFDGRDIYDVEDLIVYREEINEAYDSIKESERTALK